VSELKISSNVSLVLAVVPAPDAPPLPFMGDSSKLCCGGRWREGGRVSWVRVSTSRCTSGYSAVDAARPVRMCTWYKPIAELIDPTSLNA
jgi:hypothetical protein